MEAPLEQLSFAGMRDVIEGTGAGPRLAKLLQNVYPIDAEGGSGVEGRPGCELSENTQLGQAGARRAQCIYQYSQLDGDEYTLCFVGGKMYQYNWGTSTWTEKTLSGVGLDTSATIYCTTFADKLVVNPNDGSNKPWTWDGSSFVSLTNASTMHGPITVYYAKLFGIKWTERSTLIWSEENDPTTGYETGGYNNAWTLGQTDQEAITAILGTNEALYYWRGRSTGAISGAVTTTFSNDGTKEGVSETIGTVSPGAIVYQNRTIYWLDADAKLHRLRDGSRIAEPLWQDLRETIKSFPRSLLSDAIGAAYTPTRMVLLGVATAADPDRYIAVDQDTGLIGGLWKGFTATAIGMVKDVSDNPKLMHGSPNGYVYTHGNPDDSLWNDQLHADDGDTTPIEHIVTGTKLGWGVKEEWYFDRADVAFRAESDLAFSFEYETSRGTYNSQNLAITTDFAEWDVAKWDEDNWTGLATGRHVAVGLEGYGRWIEPTVTHNNGSERFNLIGWRITAYPDVGEPEIP